MERAAPTHTPYRLVRTPIPASRPPVLDPAQRQVVEHHGGPLLVLAGPGTGKTTTLVEAVAQRITDRGIDPGRLLVLTFSRKAAQELRRADRAAARRDDQAAAGADLPQLRLRPGAPRVRAGRG